MQHRYSQHLFVKKALRLVWVLVILFGEVWVFVWAFFHCKWPSIPIPPQGEVSSTHVLLVADTQIQHHALLQKRSWWLHPLRRIVFELNLHKNWHITSYLRPDAVIFLGDMLSNGKAAKSHQEYRAAADKFKSVFHTDPRTQVYFIPGNNDLGLGLDRSTSRQLLSYYQEFFGDPNRKFVLQNHTFIAINSAGLVDEDYLRNGEHVPFQDWTPLPDGTVSFVKQVAQQKQEPIILLSHIPLSRAESAQCGPLREEGTIRRGAGPGWQSTLSKQSTNFLLDVLRPSFIFSADNRDYCDYTHSIHPRDPSAQGYHVREITLKSFSLSVHIRRPGFQLLTLVDPAHISQMQHEPTSHDPPSLAERACFLPDQFRIYNFLYAPLFVLSLFILARFRFLKPKNRQSKIKHPFLAVETGLAGRLNEDRNPLTESPTSLSMSSPIGAEPMWTPFTPFIPITPLGQTLSSTTRQHSTTSVTSDNSLYPESSDCSSLLSSTATLLGGENSKEGDCHFGIEHEQLVYDFPPEYTMNKPEKASFDFTSVSKKWEESFGPRYSYTRESSTGDLEAFHDEVVDEKVLTAKVPNDDIGNWRRSGLRWCTSPSFVFPWRMRRIRLTFLPSRNALWNLMEFLGVVDERPSLSRSRLVDTRSLSVLSRRSGLRDRGYLVDLVVVFWPAVVLWLVVNGVSMLL